MDKIFKNEDGNEASQSNSTADGGSSSSNQNPQPSVIDDRVMGDFSSEARFFKVNLFKNLPWSIYDFIRILHFWLQYAKKLKYFGPKTMQEA